MAGAGRIKGITIEIEGNTTKLVSSLKDVDKQIKNTQTALKDVDKLLKLDPGNTELLQQKQKLLGDAVNQTSERLSQLKDAQASVAKGTAEWDALQREIIETEQELDSLKNALSDFGSVSAQKLKVVGEKFQEAGEKIQAVGDKIKGAGDKLQGIGSNLSAKVTAPIVGGLAAATKTAVDFEDAIAKVSTIADTSEISMDSLTDQIKALSDETGVAATDIADNVYNAISAGQETGDAVGFVGNAAKLAAAGFTDSASALDVLTTTLNAYGMEASDVTKVSDVLIQTQNMGKTTVGELAAYMGKVIPTAKGAGVELEQVAASYAKLTANGIKTAESTTYLNSMLNELNKGGTKVSKALQKISGKSFSEMMKEGKSLADVLNVLQEAADKSGVQFSDMWSSAEAGKAAAVIHDTTNKLGDFNAAVTQMKDAGGATEDAFAKMDTTSRQAQIALNQIKNSAIELGSTVITMLAPYFEQLTNKVKQVTEWFNNLDDSQKEMIVKIAGIVAAVGPALVVVGKVVAGVGSIVGIVGKLVSGLGTVMTAISAIGGPITLIIAAIGALVAAFAYFYNTNEEFRNSVNALVEQVKSIIGGLIEQITAWFKEHETEIKAIIEVVKTIILTGLQNIVTAISTALDVLGSIFKAFEAIMQGDWRTALEYLKSAARSAVNGVTQIFKNLGSMLNSIFKDIISKFKQWGKDMIDNLVSGIKGKIDTVKDAIKNVADVIKSYIHFSVPDVGPLADADTYAPDMMKLFAQGINDNAHLITDAIGTSFDLRPYFTSMNNGLNRLANAATNSANTSGQQGPVVVNVALEGDANRLFRVLSEEAHRDWQMTGQSKLMGY